MAKKFLTSLKLVNLNSDPSVGSEGELYFNTSASVAKIYKSGAWSELGAGGGSNITVSTTEPASPETGDAWYKNDTGELYIYDGTYWVEVNGTISLSQEQVQDYIAPMFTSASGTNVVAVYDDANNVINLSTSGSLISVDSIVYPDYVTFDITPENTSEEVGTLSWDTDFETLKLQLNGVTLQIGQEHIIRVKNNSNSVAIPNRTAVMFSGAAGDTVKVSPAISTLASEPELLVGITTEEIDADGFGFVTQFGFVNNVNTASWSLGDLLYVDPATPGLLTNVKPTAPNWTFPIAAVTRVHASSGRILSRAIPGKHLHDIVDVLISGSVQNNQGLVYNSSSSVWTNESIVNSVNGTDNQILVDNSGIGDVTFSLSNDLITPGNLTVTGDLTVSGSTTYLNTQTLNIEDNTITLNSNVTGAPSGTAGIEVERGTEENSYILWDESLQAWHFSNDINTYAIRSENILELNVSASAGSSGEIDLLTDFAELNINTDGSIDLRPGDVSGFETYKFTKTNLQFPDLSQQDTAFLGMSNYDTDDLNEGSSNLYFTNQRAVDALTSTLANYLTLSSASSTYLTQSDASLTYLTQASASSTYLTTETDPVFVASDAYQITSASTAAWNESYSWGDHSTAGYSLTSHNHSLDSLSNVVISGLADGDSIVWNSASSKWVNEVPSGGGGATTTVSETAPSTPSMGDSWYKPSDGSFFIYDGSYWVEVTSIITMSDEEAQDKVAPLFNHASHINMSASYDDGNNKIILASTDTLSSVTSRGATTSNAISITNVTESTSTSTGALIVSGGLGVGKDVWIEGNLHVSGTTVTENTQTVATHDNLIYLNAALDSTITNAVYSSGSIIYTADNLYVAEMDIRITGVSPSAFNISSGDLLTVASATPTQFVVIKSDPGASYISGGTAHAKEEVNPDLGFAGGYYDAGYAHAGLFRDASDGVFKFFQGYTPEPDEAVNIDTTHASFAFADIQIRNIKPQGSGQNDNFGIGYNATLNATGFANFGIGQNAFSGGSGTNNFAFGDDSMENNTGGGNFAFGDSALTDNTGNYNYGIGYNALQNNSGWDNYSIGPALYANTGDWNYAIGYFALSENTGDYNSAFGYEAGVNNTGSYNVYIGKSAGLSTSNNIVIADNEGNIRAQYLSASSGWTLGNIVSATWNGNTIDYQYGGTGLTSLGSAGYVLAVNATVDGLEWVEMTGGGGGGPSTTTTLITTNSATAIESFATATSRTAEAIIQITQGTDYYASKVLLIHDGTTVKITEYAILESTTGAIPLTISSAISGSNVELLATITDAATTNATAKVVMTEVAV
jgi:hypothetical protein